MKRFLCFFVSICMILPLCACGRPPKETQPIQSNQPTQATPVTSVPQPTKPLPTVPPTTGATIPPTTGQAPTTPSVTVPTEPSGPSIPTNPSTPTVPTNPTTPTEPTIPTDPVPKVPMVSASLPVIDDRIYSADGVELFRHTYQDVVLNLPNSEIAKAITLDLLKRMDSGSANVASLTQKALNTYKAGNKWTPYYYQVLYMPTRVDEIVLSLQGIYTSFDGMISTSDSANSANYNLVTGKFLSILDILSEESTAAQTVSQLLVQELGKVATQKQLFSDYAQTVSARFQMDLDRYYAWYFSEEGLCFYFAPYDIAPQASGTVEITIPYNKLSGILRDDYFPTEEQNVAATVTGKWFSQADPSSFSRISEVIVDPDGEVSLLTCDTLIYNVRILQGYWNANTSKFVPSHTVYRANCLSAGSALVIRSNISSTAPTLMLQYNSAGKTHTLYLIKSANGALQLLQNPASASNH